MTARCGLAVLAAAAAAAAFAAPAGSPGAGPPAAVTAAPAAAAPAAAAPAAAAPAGARASFEGYARALHGELGLAAQGLEYAPFRYGLLGHCRLRERRLLARPGILSIVDYRLSSNRERLFVLDLERRKLLHRSLVAHGRGSGDEYARSFSNGARSLKSSLGFYVTGSTYRGKHGYSLRLEGLDPGFNDKAGTRAIVMHGATYVSRAFALRHRRIGRSWGCPAVPMESHREIIDTINSQYEIKSETEEQLKKAIAEFKQGNPN